MVGIALSVFKKITAISTEEWIQLVVTVDHTIHVSSAINLDSARI